MKHVNALTMADIQITNILYYDPAFKQECYKFCKERDIDCLPALEDPRRIFRRMPETVGFVEEAVSEERIVPDWQDIFDPGLAATFAKNALLLVFSQNRLTGVVHFSDYNQPVVSIYLYRLFLAYEKALRTILELYGHRNKDMIEYFEFRMASDKARYIAKIKAYQRWITKNEKTPEFQSFYLTDLIELAEHKNIIFVENRVTELRNMVMHAHDFVHREDPHTPDLIYNPATFQNFFELAVTLHRDYKRVANHLAFKNTSGTSQESHA